MDARYAACSLDRTQKKSVVTRVPKRHPPIKATKYDVYIYIIHSSYLFSLAKKIVFSSPTAVTLFVFFVYGLCDDRTEEAHRHIKANNNVLAVQRSLIVVRPNS